MAPSGSDDRSGTTSPGVEFLFEQTTDCIVEGTRQDGEPIVHRVNDAFETVFGYTNAELRGENLNDFITPEGKRTEVEAVDEAIRAGDIGPREVTRQTADGPRDFLLRATGGVGELSYAIYTDITAQKERERQLQRERDRLDEFVGIVSHDLCNPLHTAAGHLELLREECDSDHIEQIDTALTRMDELIDDLLTLARQGERIGEMEYVHLADLAGDCWQTAGTAEATLRVQADQSLAADSSRLTQLFENLIRNAVEHGGEDVTVTVGAVEDGFYVEDDGPGISEDERKKVFEAGYSTAEDGTGFGLSIVKQVAHAHGWEVRVTDGSQGGARFEITGVTFATE